MGNLKLVSILGDCDLLYLDSFFAHYIKLGVSVNGFLIAYHLKDESNMQRSFEVFDKYKIYPKIIFAGEWYNINQGDAFSKKEFYLNFLMKFTGHDDRILRSDADERHQYQFSLRKMINICEKYNYDVISGIRIDRLSRDGVLRDINISKSLDSQFPIGTVISSELFQKRKSSCYKVMITKQHVNIKNAGFHDVSGEYKIYPHKQLVHHFKWTSEVIMKMKIRSQGWYASDGLREALTFENYMTKNDRKISIDNLILKLDFSAKILSNILDTSSLGELNRFNGLGKQISRLYSYKDNQSIDYLQNSIPRNTYSYLNFMDENKDYLVNKSCFEYGGGNSTIYYCSLGLQVHTVDHDIDRISKLKGNDIIDASHLLHRPLGATYIQSIAEMGKKYDIVCIDGRDR